MSVSQVFYPVFVTRRFYSLDGESSRSKCIENGLNQARPLHRFLQRTLPSFRGSDCRGIIKQPVFLLLLGQPREPGVKWVVGRQESLLAMEELDRVRTHDLAPSDLPAPLADTLRFQNRAPLGERCVRRSQEPLQLGRLSRLHQVVIEPSLFRQPPILRPDPSR